ncbi:hypothetical protein [Flavobacterium filum]|uniref:hypothetical protein n=1 Tax=Flavobacterium filum TaxID=370974 RepID=UPI0023F4DBA9|nr:hypothetical protein [Flavobacterium filum]
MSIFIFDLNSLADNGEQYNVEVKVCTQTLENDHTSIDKNSDDIECERKDHHENSPFVLNQQHQSERIETDCNEICYRVNNGNWHRHQNGGTIQI